MLLTGGKFLLAKSNNAVSQQPPQLGIAPTGQLTYSQVSNDPRLQGNVLNGHVQGSQLAKQDSVLTGRGSNGNGSKRGRKSGKKFKTISTRAWPNDPHSITEEDSSDGTTTDDSGYVAQGGKLPSNHPARHLPPVDILLLVDSSSSIGISNFEAVKANIINVLEDVDIGPGRSRVALVQYALQPSVVFGFDKYYSLKSVKKGVERMSYTGGATMLSKALSFAAGLLYKEQNMRDVKKRKHKLMPTPRHDRLQIMAMVTRSFHKDRLVAVTRFEGSIFVMDQKESISIWLWRQQRMWAENYAAYIEREKSMPLSLKHSPKKNNREMIRRKLEVSSNTLCFESDVEIKKCERLLTCFLSSTDPSVLEDQQRRLHTVESGSHQNDTVQKKEDAVAKIVVRYAYRHREERNAIKIVILRPELAHMVNLLMVASRRDHLAMFHMVIEHI
ncbi:von Willebrand factor type A domain protein [Necator americanus]|uniref:von Willebrand factor type A domain protein n=1 Tax=Necator americanus TaxID=51031 RepID=W2SY54_NECAM|nr:von Willebrand factor type A domain protein [Necator americanus]ETN74699.1 von Willebrand factor type A domain protein [Necator americanus]